MLNFQLSFYHRCFKSESLEAASLRLNRLTLQRSNEL